MFLTIFEHFNASWIFLPLLASLIGWFTNYLAIKMLFRPQKIKNIIGMKIQGIIPKRRGDLAKTIGKTIEEELFTKGDLSKAIQKLDFVDQVKPILKEKTNLLLNVKMKEINPMLISLLPPPMLEKIENAIVEEILKALPEFTEKIADSFSHQLQISHMVVENINKFDLNRLEDLIVTTAKQEFKFIEYLGAILGFGIGVLQVLLMNFNLFT